MWLATLSLAMHAMSRHKMRTMLTTLGIVIGVASVIAMVTLGQSATARITTDITALGQNMLMVVPGAQPSGPIRSGAAPFKLDDVRAIEREFPELEGVAPTVTRGELVVHRNANHSSIVYGTTNAFFRVRNLKLVRGREFSDAELAGGTTACILGETVRKRLFASEESLDSAIRVGAISCRVVGILESKGRSAFGQDQDEIVVMPLPVVQRRLAGNADVGMVFISVANARAISATKIRLEGLLRERRHLQAAQKDDFLVQDTREIAKTLSSVTGALTAVLGAVAAVALLVGGIGIMNVMLVSVTERTHEIGLRRALGALSREVLLQFLVEAVLLCATGGALGVAVSLTGSWLLARALSMPFQVEPLVVVGALLFAAVTGIAFGYFPARKAARLDPIEALRGE